MSDWVIDFSTFMLGFVSGASVGIVVFIILGYIFIRKGDGFNQLTKKQ